MRKRIIIVIVILFIISAIFFVNRFKFSFYKNVCGASVQKQFSEKYGLQTKLIYVDHNDNNFFGGEVMLETMDGVSVICDYNILGSMIGDSYVNMIYAYDDIKRVDQYVNKYFDNYNVIESFMMSSDLDDFYYEYYAVGEDSSSTYADYLMATKNHQRYLIIQLCEEHDLSGVEGLLDDLEKEFADQDNFTIFIKNYPEGLYSAKLIKTPLQVGERFFCITDVGFDDNLIFEVADDVFVVGYPFGRGSIFTDVLPIPVWKRASIASEMDLNYYMDDRPVFLVDTMTKPGMSGSPVIGMAKGLMRGINGSVSIGTGYAMKFLGVYSGRVDGQQNNESCLGLVWKKEFIDEIIDGGFRDEAY